MKETKRSLPSGFAGSYDDMTGGTLNINELLIKHPAATFIMRVGSNVMAGSDIINGDIAVIDRSLSPQPGSIVVAAIEGTLLIRRYKIANGQVSLTDGDDDNPHVLKEDENILCWGVVTSIVRQYKHSP